MDGQRNNKQWLTLALLLLAMAGVFLPCPRLALAQSLPVAEQKVAAARASGDLKTQADAALARAAEQVEHGQVFAAIETLVAGIHAVAALGSPSYAGSLHRLTTELAKLLVRRNWDAEACDDFGAMEDRTCPYVEGDLRLQLYGLALLGRGEQEQQLIRQLERSKRPRRMVQRATERYRAHLLVATLPVGQQQRLRTAAFAALREDGERDEDRYVDVMLHQLDLNEASEPAMQRQRHRALVRSVDLRVAFQAWVGRELDQTCGTRCIKRIKEFEVIRDSSVAAQREERQRYLQRWCAGPNQECSGILRGPFKPHWFWWTTLPMIGGDAANSPMQCPTRGMLRIGRPPWLFNAG